MEGFIQSAPWVLPVVVIVILVIIGGLYVKSRYKTVKASEALVITGAKRKILPGGGAFVPPGCQAQIFPLGIITVTSGGQPTMTNEFIPVMVEYSAQIRPGADDMLRMAVENFGDTEQDDIASKLLKTLDGAVRTVVATMTAREVVVNKDQFNERVLGIAKRSMADLGYDLVSLLIADVTDNLGYYTDLAAPEREEKRQTAADRKAEADEKIAVRQAQADKTSAEAASQRDLSIDDQNRQVATRRLDIEAETDKQRAAAAVARAQQAKAEATAQREVDLTRAETAKQVAETEAQAEARRAEIEAEAAATVANRQAQAKADAEVIEAQAKADAITRTTEARATEIRETGVAEAAAARAKAQAEADAIRAKGEAEAATQQLMAQALAANNGANLQLEIARIQAGANTENAQVLATALHEIGTNTTIIGTGGGSGAGSNPLMDFLLGLPMVVKQLNLESGALNGGSFGNTLGELIAQVSGKSDSDNGTPQQTDPTVEMPAPAESSTPATYVVAATISDLSPDSTPDSKTLDAD